LQIWIEFLLLVAEKIMRSTVRKFASKEGVAIKRPAAIQTDMGF
jgi:hypothetical protein